MSILVLLASSLSPGAGVFPGQVSPIDWTNGVIVPLVMTVFIGTGLAMWTGVALARLVAFDVARMRCVETLVEMSALLNAQSFNDLQERHNTLCTRLLTTKFEFLRLRQIEPIAVIDHIVKRINNVAWGPLPSGTTFPLGDEEKQKQLERLMPYAMAWSKMLFDLRPSISGILTWRRSALSDENHPNFDSSKLAAREAAYIAQQKKEQKS